MCGGGDYGQRSRRRRGRNHGHHFRRFAVGFYNPNFRDLWFNRSERGGIYESVLSVLAGNWNPSLRVRLRLHFFFLLVALQRVFDIAPRGPRAPQERGR